MSTTTVAANKQVLANYLTGYYKQPELTASQETGNMAAEAGGYIAFGAAVPAAMTLWNKSKNMQEYLKNNPSSSWRTAWAQPANTQLAALNNGKGFWCRRANSATLSELNSFDDSLLKIYKKNRQLAVKDRYYDYYKEAKELIKKAKQEKNPKRLQVLMKQIRKAVSQGDLKLNEAYANNTLNRPSLLGRAWQKVKNKTGISKLQLKALNSAKGGKLLQLAKYNKYGKVGGVVGAGLVLAGEAFCEYGNVKDAYAIDKKHGNKQLVKSSVKVASKTAGFLAGAKGGAAFGAAIGTFFGGPVGSAVGGVLGAAIGGVLGSWGAGKAAEAVVGKQSEAELYAKEQAKKKAELSKDKLLAEVAEKAGQTIKDEKGNEVQVGFNTKEELAAYEALIGEQEREIAGTAGTSSAGQNTGSTSSLLNALAAIANLAPAATGADYLTNPFKINYSA